MLYLVYFVADKHLDNVMFSGVCVQLIKPRLQSVKCVLLSDIIHKYNALRPSVVTGCECPEPFLTSCVLKLRVKKPFPYYDL